MIGWFFVFEGGGEKEFELILENWLVCSFDKVYLVENEIEQNSIAEQFFNVVILWIPNLLPEDQTVFLQMEK